MAVGGDLILGVGDRLQPAREVVGVQGIGGASKAKLDESTSDFTRRVAWSLTRRCENSRCINISSMVTGTMNSATARFSLSIRCLG